MYGRYGVYRCLLRFESDCIIWTKTRSISRLKPKEKFIRSIWIFLQVLLFAIVLYSMITQNRTESECKWILILFFSELILYLITTVKKKTSIRKDFSAPEVICFLVLSIGQLEITSQTAYDFHAIGNLIWNFILLLFFFFSFDCLIEKTKICGCTAEYSHCDIKHFQPLFL